MLRRLLGCVLVLAPACYAPSYRDCEITCTPAKGCPSGLTCDEQLGVCRTGGASVACGEPIDAPAGDGKDALDAAPSSDDLDGDGRPNLSDNCPMISNADQNDEDGDSFGDACDPCPIDANNADADMDGVGDKCDPRPNMPGDTMTFYGLGTWPPPGAMLEGAWSSSNGHAVFNNTAGQVSRVLWPSAMNVHRRVSAHFDIESTVSGTNYVGPVVDHGGDSGGTTGIGCVISAPQIAASRNLVLVGSTLLAIGNPATAGFGPITLTAVENGANNWSCEATNQPAISGPYTHAATGPRDGVVTAAAKGTLDWVMIVVSP